MTTFRIWTDKFVQVGNTSTYKGQSFTVEADTVDQAKAQITIEPGYRIMGWSIWESVDSFKDYIGPKGAK